MAKKKLEMDVYKPIPQYLEPYLHPGGVKTPQDVRDFAASGLRARLQGDIHPAHGKAIQSTVELMHASVAAEGSKDKSGSGNTIVQIMNQINQQQRLPDAPQVSIIEDVRRQIDSQPEPVRQIEGEVVEGDVEEEGEPLPLPPLPFFTRKPVPPEPEEF